MSGPFDELKQGHTARDDASARFERDMRETMKMLMMRREGRVFIRSSIEATTDIILLRSYALRILEYVEATHV